MSRRYEIDMTRGPLFGKLLRFALPAMLSNVLQLLYNAADMIIVGRYDIEGKASLAAVGSTASVIHLVTNLFMGVTLGASIIIAQYRGAEREEDVSRTVHTAALSSFLCGVFVTVVGLVISEPMLIWMDTPPDVFDKALLYIRIYFLGMTSMLVYNFGASALRAIGDTKRPLYFLTAAGVLNVLLNLLFVVVLRFGVAGVALATVISQTLSAVLVIVCLVRSDGSIRLRFSKLRIHADKLAAMLRIGLPIGLQNSLFSISNVLVQSSVNSFGSAAMAAHTAAVSIEGFMNAVVKGVADASMNFTGQNVGAGENLRVKRVCAICGAAAAGCSLALGTVIFCFGSQLLSIYNPDPEVIAYGLNRIMLVGLTYWTFGLMQVFAGCLRGMGRSTLPMICSLLGICGFRILYIYTVFPLSRTLLTLYFSYPASWTVAMLANMICYFVISRKLIKGTLRTAVKRG